MIDMSYNLGPQPLDQIMVEQGLSNHAVVAASKNQLTHKVVNKARKGRRLTRRSQDKVLLALNEVSSEKNFSRSQLFNYEGS